MAFSNLLLIIGELLQNKTVIYWRIKQQFVKKEITVNFPSSFHKLLHDSTELAMASAVTLRHNRTVICCRISSYFVAE